MKHRIYETLNLSMIFWSSHTEVKFNRIDSTLLYYMVIDCGWRATCVINIKG